MQEIKDLIWEFENGSLDIFELIKRLKEVCNIDTVIEEHK